MHFLLFAHCLQLTYIYNSLAFTLRELIYLAGQLDWSDFSLIILLIHVATLQQTALFNLF